MLVTENVLEQALAQVFDGKSAGASLTLTDITTGWTSVGLRKADLRDALREMVEAQCLLVENQLGSLIFTLTEHGALRFEICRHHKTNLQNWLEERREIENEYRLVDALSASWNRRSLQH